MLMALLHAAHAEVRFDLGAGLRHVDTPYDGGANSGRLVGRLGPHPNLAIELGLAARFPSRAVSSLGEGLAIWAYEANNETSFRVPVDRELGALSLFTDLSPFPRVRRETVVVWPYALIGGEVRLVRHDVGRLTEAYMDGSSADPLWVRVGETEVFPTLAGGLGFDAWFADRIGTRIHWIGRASIGAEPDYNNLRPDGSHERPDTGLLLSSAVGLDVMVRL